MKQAHVQLKKATRTYGAGETLVEALKAVDLDVGAGEFVALMGPSGSGKSTCLNLIGCIDPPTTGKVMVDGIDVGALSAAKRTEFRKRHVGFVFQDYSLLPVLTTYENVELPLQLVGDRSRREMEQEVRSVLERVGLGKLADRRPSALSGGQQQRVAIARALVKRPAVLLADEPTANLDSGTAHQIMQLMKELNALLGTTCVLSSHDPIVTQYATRIIQLRDGHVVPEA